MKEHLYILILIPALTSILELSLKKLGFKSKFAGILSIIALLSCLTIVISQDLSAATNSLLWIPGWGINFIISMNGISAVVLPAILLVILCSVVISKSDEKDGLYYFFIMLLTALVCGFCLSNNLIFKIFFWEACWVPIFCISLYENKSISAKSFSATWFISESALLLGAIIIHGQLQEVSFWLFIIASYIRMMLFPVDKLTDRFSAEGSSGFSAIVNIILPILPLLFIMQVVLPSFQHQVTQYGSILYFVFLGSGLLRIFRSCFDKGLNSIINSQIIVFNSLFAGFILATGQTSIGPILELVTIKLLLGLVILFYGLESIRLGLNAKRPATWIMITAVVLSFGLSGITFSKPMLSIISSINITHKLSGLYSWALMLILLVLTSLRFTTAIAVKNKTTNSRPYASITMAIMILLVITAVFLGYYDYV